jgi:hypothetical protein
MRREKSGSGTVCRLGGLVVPLRGVRVTNDVDGAAVGKQVIKLRLVAKFVDRCR